MEQALCHQPLTAEAQVQLLARPCNICDVTKLGFSPSPSAFPCPVSFHQCSALTFHSSTINAISYFSLTPLLNTPLFSLITQYQNFLEKQIVTKVVKKHAVVESEKCSLVFSVTPARTIVHTFTYIHTEISLSSILKAHWHGI
jgi:hypothetical protein